MKAYEFNTDIKDNIIHLPKNYPYSSLQNVKVIILVDEEINFTSEKSNTQEIIDAFAEVASQNVFSSLQTSKEILNWQKQLRDEWE
jgi:hypothetical protein